VGESPRFVVRLGTLIAIIASAVVLAVLLSNGVVARGSAPVRSIAIDNSPPTAPDPFTASSVLPQPEDTGSRHLAARSVCVRLCDGAFFPIVSTSSSTDNAKYAATCAGLCPDAQTALYFEAAGSDKIEDAVSTNGVSYTALPAALRFRTALDATCTCRRKLAQQFSIMLDSTLRKGDYVMTPKGLVVFTGSRRLPHTRSDFIALGDAGLSQVQRAALLAMDRARPPAADGPTDTIPSPTN
jgi:hypothetical protein